MVQRHEGITGNEKAGHLATRLPLLDLYHSLGYALPTIQMLYGLENRTKHSLTENNLLVLTTQNVLLLSLAS